MDATVLLAAFDKKASKHIPGAAKSVIRDVENDEFKTYLASKPAALEDAIKFLAKAEFIAQASKTALAPELEYLIKARLAHIQRVFVVDVITAKGEAHLRKYLETDEPEDMFAQMMRDVSTASKEVVRLARSKRWGNKRYH